MTGDCIGTIIELDFDSYLTVIFRSHSVLYNIQIMVKAVDSLIELALYVTDFMSRRINIYYV